MQIDIDLLLSE